MGGGHIRLTASAALKLKAGKLKGFYVSSTTSGTITLYDNIAASGQQISGVITPAVGWHDFPARFSHGCYAEIGATIDVTFIVES